MLTGADARQQLLVTAIHSGGEVDATDEAVFASSNPKIATVSEDGVVLPVGNGSAVISATFDGRSSSVDVRVERVAVLPSPHFARDIIPLLTKAGCNSGACHGKQSGQNGFKLSVFGHDVGADYQAIVCEGRGRRLFPSVPRESLLLTKATNRVPHGGGGRLEENSTEYRRLLR
ncbi:MAG: Ig-like domain-containing protein [Planctomycetia bacterium]|nr:Ig-like domain-containing protein [Planctomycetia bacterium]